jgi:acetyl-CoA C-acetyltransferase
MIFLTINVKILEEDLDWSPSWREHVALKNTGDDMSRVMGLDPVAQIHGEAALGAVADAGLSLADVDGYFCGGDAPGFGAISMVEYLGLSVRYTDCTETGGSSYVGHVGHAAAAIAAGRCSIALITLGGKPRTAQFPRPIDYDTPELAFELTYGMNMAPMCYALAAQRHMYEFGTTSAQLAEVRVAASIHAQCNPDAMLREPVTVEQVLDSPLAADPLHRLDCCVVSDGGGALVVVSPEVARTLPRSGVTLLGHGEAPKHADNGRIDLTYSGAVWSGPTAFAEASIGIGDVDYVSLYDSFTFTVIQQLEDLGFCDRGAGGRFVLDGALQARDMSSPVFFKATYSRQDGDQSRSSSNILTLIVRNIILLLRSQRPGSCVSPVRARPGSLRGEL